MGPLPSTNLAGHQPLKRKIDYALDRLEELPSVDFKQSSSWIDLRGNIVRSILGMGNLRDGGLIIVGVAESNEKWELAGISDEHRGTYSFDDMKDCVAKYVSPGVEFSVVEHSYQERVFLVIHVKPFVETPLVCKRDWPDEKL